MIKQIAIAAALSAAALSSAQAGVVVGAKSAQIVSGGPGEGNINSTFDQWGLLTEYEDGVTDFATYIASNPLHVSEPSVEEGGVTYFYEWFSNNGSTTATVTYDLGKVHQILGMALWNEDGLGIGKLKVEGSIDGVTWNTLANGLTPTNNAPFKDYGADVFSWTASQVRYVKLDASQCSSFLNRTGCGFGEVAFNATTPVPEAGSVTMAALGFAAVCAVAARRRRQQA